MNAFVGILLVALPFVLLGGLITLMIIVIGGGRSK
jgi:hypothetical protein